MSKYHPIAKNAMTYRQLHTARQSYSRLSDRKRIKSKRLSSRAAIALSRMASLMPTRKQWMRQLALLLVLGTLLMGCTDISEPVAESAEESVPAEPEITLSGPGQLLEVSAIAQIKDQTFELEVAETPQQQALGLMFRSELPANRGMLFPFANPRRASFWMKDVPVGLDMVFIRSGQVVAVITAPPCLEDPCETYGPADNQIVDQVLELRAGRAAEIGLQPGDSIRIQPLPKAKT